MKDPVIRRAKIGDYDVIGRLLAGLLAQHAAGRPDLFEHSSGDERKYSEKEYSELLNDPNSAVFVAEADGETVGYLICKIITENKNPVLKNIKTLYLDDLCVAEDSRGKGAGKALMRAAEVYARENGFYNITLNVWEFNSSAREFYRHLGYETQRREMEKVL